MSNDTADIDQFIDELKIKLSMLPKDEQQKVIAIIDDLLKLADKTGNIH